VIDEAAAIQIAQRTATAVDRGARLLTGARRDRALLTPAVLDHVPADATLIATETFGPVAP
jgi:acyl-CoA reductase-like NAD-dependent aldehyde dehydrogenase